MLGQSLTGLIEFDWFKSLAGLGEFGWVRTEFGWPRTEFGCVRRVWLG